jgi:cytochrome P450
LYRLLENPEYIEPLRQEVDAVTTEEGWTKAGIDKMHKIDSFLRETMRVDNFNLCSLSSFPSIPSKRYWFTSHFFLDSHKRLALRPFTFSNGVTIPAGTLVSFPTSATQTDEEIYTNADEVDGFRFAKLRETESDSMASKHQAASASSENLVFGLGRHTW